MPNIVLIIFFFVICFFSLKYYIKIANELKFTDIPNLLSNHKKSLPTGAGIVFIILISLTYFFLILGYNFLSLPIDFPNRHYLFLISILILGIISFIDDIKSIHPVYRFSVHLVTVLISIPLFSYDIIYFLPEKLLFLIIIFLWAYLINIFNFIDGSNGYLSINSIFIFVSFLITSYFDSSNLGNYDFNFIIVFFTTIILIIYLYFNFPKPKVFCGDSGSIVIGYIIGYIAFDLIFNNYWYIAVSVLSYPIIDVSITIFNKVKEGKYPWERLFDYFFLKALNRTNKNHNRIFLISFYYNLINLTIILLMLFLNIKYICILSVILAFLKIYIFSSIKFKN